MHWLEVYLVCSDQTHALFVLSVDVKLKKIHAT